MAKEDCYPEADVNDVSRRPAVSAAEREAAVARLSAAFANDVLTLDEFERRMESVYSASTQGALVQIVKDLPGEPARAPSDALVAPARMAQRLAIAFGSIERDERVVVPPQLDIRAVFGNIELDLRNAEFGPGVTEISIQAIVANVEIQLPPHVGVENHGDTFIGSFTSRVRGRRRNEHALPALSTSRVRITGRAVFGNVEIQRETTGQS